jgi:mono/diheme cytochrome c family protein
MFDTVYKLLEQMGYPHPIHPTEVHMPIGLIVGALVFRVAATLFRRPALAQTAHYCTILAGLFLLPTILFGFMDWQHFYAGAWLYPIKIKLVLAGVLLVLVFASVFLARKKGAASGIVLTNYAASFLVVVVLGYYGGNLVYGGARPKAPEADVAGMDVFNENCAACHPKGGNVIVPSLPLLTSAYTQNPATFLAFIRNPRRPDGSAGAMPSFSPTKISDQQASELYKYIADVLEH